MKALMISDRAKWCALMMNGDKTIEVRTSKALAKAIQKLIDENGYAEIYVYCTKEEYLTCDLYTGKARYHNIPKGKSNFTLSGKVVFKFRCDKVEEIYRSGSYLEYLGEEIDAFVTNELDNFQLLGCACLEVKEMGDYFESKYEACVGYAIHISNLEIFDKPKELGEFKHPKPSICGVKDDKGLYQCDKCKYGYSEFMHCECRLPLTKAPQSFMFIEVEE